MPARYLAFLSVAAVGATALAGGPLTPPGPPTPTPGPEPRTPINDLPGNALAQHVISEPGSYYLSGNIQGEGGGKHGVLITTPGPVVIDGMGFRLVGVAGAGDAFHVLDNTNEPIRWKISNAWPTSWQTPARKSSGSGDTDPSVVDVMIAIRFHWDTNGAFGIEWEGDLTVRDSSGRGGGILNSGGTLTISDSTISGNSANYVIDADGLFMTDCDMRGGDGVRAKKPREIVVVGSKVKEVVRGVSLDLAEGAIVRDSENDGAVDAHDYLLWQRNRTTVDFSDPFFTPSNFGVGSRVEESTFHFTGVATGQTGATASEEVAFYYNKIEFNGAGTPSSLVQFNTGRSTIANNLVQGVPGGGAGFQVNGILNIVRDNDFFGAGDSSFGVIGTAARSMFRNNTMMNIGTPFSLSGAGLNYVAQTLDPMTAPTNDSPDRNLEIPPVDPVR